MNNEIIMQLKSRNVLLAQRLLDGKIYSDSHPLVREGELFTVSVDPWFNYIILTGFNEHWPDRFITHMEHKLKTHVTTVFRWEGDRGEHSLADITDVMMDQVYERIR